MPGGVLSRPPLHQHSPSRNATRPSTQPTAKPSAAAHAKHHSRQTSRTWPRRKSTAGNVTVPDETPPAPVTGLPLLSRSAPGPESSAAVCLPDDATNSLNADPGQPFGFCSNCDQSNQACNRSRDHCHTGTGQLIPDQAHQAPIGVDHDASLRQDMPLERLPTDAAGKKRQRRRKAKLARLHRCRAPSSLLDAHSPDHDATSIRAASDDEDSTATPAMDYGVRHLAQHCIFLFLCLKANILRLVAGHYTPIQNMHEQHARSAGSLRHQRDMTCPESRRFLNC